MNVKKKLLLSLVLLSLSLPCPAEDKNKTTSSPRLVFFRNDSEYAATILKEPLDPSKIPDKLKRQAKEGDLVGYRFYQGKRLEKEVSGVIKNGKVTLSNGAEITTEGRSVIEIFNALKETNEMLTTPNYGFFD